MALACGCSARKKFWRRVFSMYPLVLLIEYLGLVILAAAADSGCRFLLSEDPQEGFTWKGTDGNV